MRIANLEIVKLLKPRLGFGAPPEVRAESSTQVEEPALPEAAPAGVLEAEEVVSKQDFEAVDDTQLSLLLLAQQLETTVKAEPAFSHHKDTDCVEQSAPLCVPIEPDIPRRETKELTKCEETAAPARLTRAPKGLEGCKVGAIGFGRQDIAGLAAAMIERRARIEFLPRSEAAELHEFDLVLLNAASVEILKREAAHFRDVIATGVPTIVVGSRTALNVLRENTTQMNWDFAAKPIHYEELTWRACTLLARAETSGEARRLPARVVLADQDPFTRSLIESAMSQLGVQCQSAEEGETAWNLIERSSPGAVILDLTLPNRDGFQLLADIRRAPGRKPKIIVLSARQSEADILRAFSLGADDYITKPFSPLELSARLTRLLGGLPENG